jgi:hypothetical protein
MKVYYEKSQKTAVEIMNTILSLAEKYERFTGNVPNKLSMTQDEFDILEDYFLKNFPTYKQDKDEHAGNLAFRGMEIIINDN